MKMKCKKESMKVDSKLVACPDTYGSVVRQVPSFPLLLISMLELFKRNN